MRGMIQDVRKYLCKACVLDGSASKTKQKEH